MKKVIDPLLTLVTCLTVYDHFIVFYFIERSLLGMAFAIILLFALTVNSYENVPCDHHSTDSTSIEFHDFCNGPFHPCKREKCEMVWDESTVNVLNGDHALCGMMPLDTFTNMCETVPGNCPVSCGRLNCMISKYEDPMCRLFSNVAVVQHCQSNVQFGSMCQLSCVTNGRFATKGKRLAMMFAQNHLQAVVEEPMLSEIQDDIMQQYFWLKDYLFCNETLPVFASIRLAAEGQDTQYETAGISRHDVPLEVESTDGNSSPIITTPTIMSNIDGPSLPDATNMDVNETTLVRRVRQDDVNVTDGEENDATNELLEVLGINTTNEGDTNRKRRDISEVTVVIEAEPENGTTIERFARNSHTTNWTDTENELMLDDSPVQSNETSRSRRTDGSFPTNDTDTVLAEKKTNKKLLVAILFPKLETNTTNINYIEEEEELIENRTKRAADDEIERCTVTGIADYEADTDNNTDSDRVTRKVICKPVSTETEEFTRDKRHPCEDPEHHEHEHCRTRRDATGPLNNSDTDGVQTMMSDSPVDTLSLPTNETDAEIDRFSREISNMTSEDLELMMSDSPIDINETIRSRRVEGSFPTNETNLEAVFKDTLTKEKTVVVKLKSLNETVETSMESGTGLNEETVDLSEELNEMENNSPEAIVPIPVPPTGDAK